MLTVFKKNIGNSPLSTLDLPRIKVAPGKLLLWELTGDETEREIEGIILAWRQGRLYWKQAPDEPGAKKKPPDCTSQDGFTGIGDPGGECMKCPYAKFGTAQKGRGQACKQIRQLLIIRPGLALPYLLAIPPTSIRPAMQYFMLLYSRLIPYWGVVTKIKLEKAENEAGIAYGKMVFSLDRVLTPQEQDVLLPYQEKMEQLLAPLAIVSADYDTAEEPAGPQGLRSYPRLDRQPGARRRRRARARAGTGTRGRTIQDPLLGGRRLCAPHRR
jgi:hypothetical protein